MLLSPSSSARLTQRHAITDTAHLRHGGSIKHITHGCCTRSPSRVPLIQHLCHSQQADTKAGLLRRPSGAQRLSVRAEAQRFSVRPEAPGTQLAGKWRSAAASSLLQVLAAATVLAQPGSAWAGEVIQGMPRVADGDTLQASFDAMLDVYQLHWVIWQFWVCRLRTRRLGCLGLMHQKKHSCARTRRARTTHAVSMLLLLLPCIEMHCLTHYQR